MTCSSPSVARIALAFVPLLLSLSVLATELPGRATPHRLAVATRFETTYHLLESGRPGPTVLVVAGIHGNELAPPEAARRLLEWRLRRGRLAVIPEANLTALRARSRYSPGELFSDLNRNFPTASRSEPRGVLATAIWTNLAKLGPDWVLDLHEGWGFNRRNKKSMGSSVVVVPDARVVAKTRPLARRLVERVNATLPDPSRHFTVIEPGPAGSFARSATERLGIPSFVFETTRVGQPLELRVTQHLILVREALEALGML